MILKTGTIQKITFLSFLLNSRYILSQNISTQKIKLHLRPDFRGRVISFEPGLGQEHLLVSFHWARISLLLIRNLKGNI
jgi:hypothetical protein